MVHWVDGLLFLQFQTKTDLCECELLVLNTKLPGVKSDYGVSHVDSSISVWFCHIVSNHQDHPCEVLSQGQAFSLWCKKGY